MNHHAVLLNHLSGQMKAVLLPLVVVPGNGDETENMRNIKIVLLIPLVWLRGTEKYLNRRLFLVCKNALFSSWWASFNQIASSDFTFE